MIAVVFEPRFGSSKVMQALADSGYPVLGEKFPAWIDDDQRKWNPLGFYEHHAPLKAIQSNPDAAVKVRTGEIELCPNGTRFVFCLRDVTEATKSQIRSGMVQWVFQSDGEMHNTECYAKADFALSGKDVIRMEHSEWLVNPEAEKARLLRWAHGH
jgi:hypothetical protein